MKPLKLLAEYKLIAGCVVGLIFATIAVESRYHKVSAFDGYTKQQTAIRYEDKISDVEDKILFLLRPYQGDVSKATAYDKAIYDQLQMKLNKLYRKSGIPRPTGR